MNGKTVKQLETEYWPSKVSHFLKWLVKPIRIPFIVVGIAVILLWAVLQGYSLTKFAWTGFGDYTTPAGDFVRGKTLWDWLELLIIPVVLGSGALLFIRSERASQRRTIEARSELERELTAENQRESALQSYFDRMADLLLKEQLRDPKNVAAQDVARVRTLTVLRALDPKRKRFVFLFLQEAGLIDPDPIIHLGGADLVGADLSRADLTGADLTEADLTGAELTGARLSAARLTGARLSGARLSGADLTGADLSRAGLSGADLTGADLSRAGLNGADLTGAYLSVGDLTGTDLSEADLTEADLRGADLRGADLRGANLGGADLRGARYDAQIKWTEGFGPEAAGAIL